MGGLTRFLQHKVPKSISTSSGSPVQGNPSPRQYVAGYLFIHLGEERQRPCLKKITERQGLHLELLPV